MGYGIGTEIPPFFSSSSSSSAAAAAPSAAPLVAPSRLASSEEIWNYITKLEVFILLLLLPNLFYSLVLFSCIFYI
jgi:hypothetical protein